MQRFFDYSVADFMTRDPITIDPEAKLMEAERLLESHDFNCLPVVDDEERLIGVVSKLDLLRAFIFTARTMIPPYEEIMRQQVRELMVEEPRVVTPDLPLTRVLQLMVETRIKSLPVVSEGQLHGMISREDVLRALRTGAAPEAT